MSTSIPAGPVFTKAIDKLPPDDNDYFLWINIGDADLRGVGHYDAEQKAFKDEVLGLYHAIEKVEWADLREEESDFPQPTPAGPVWVKASERLPEKLGVYILKNSNGDYILSYYNKSLELDFEGVIWLDDSQTAPAQQVFSREQVREAFSRGQVNALKKDAFITADEFMDKYYPLK